MEMEMERDITVEFFKCTFWGAVSTTFRAPFSPIILERRQKSIQTISPKLDKNYLD